MVFEKKTETQVNSVAIKPSFDGRLVYFDQLEKLLNNWTSAIIANNLNQQFISLKAYHILTAPYIKKEFNDEVIESFENINNTLSCKDEKIRAGATMRLNNLAYRLFDLSKHLMLPQEMMQNEEIDLEKWKR